MGPALRVRPARLAGRGRRAHRTAGRLRAWSASGPGSTRTAGLIRERVFVPEAGIDEDEATGSAALRLTALLGREIEIRQGEGSVIYARPLDDETAEIAGRVVLDEVRDYSLG